MNAPVVIETDAGSVEIQSFTPLTAQAIKVCKRYDWHFFGFAVGSEGESLLYSLNESDLVHVDHEGNGTDVESTAIEFQQLLDQLENFLPRD